MKIIRLVIFTLGLTGFMLQAGDKPLPNPNIDYPGFLANAQEVGRLWESHRVSEGDFLRMSKEPDTIIFDARSDSKFELLHVKGAVHLSLPDITASELTRVIPGFNTRILIYCNNNFQNEPISMPSKGAPASLNIFTFNTLYTYGYRNVFELAPLLDINKTTLPLQGTLTIPGKTN